MPKTHLLPPTARPAHVDKAGRFTIPKAVRQQLVGNVEGVWWWWDGRRLHVASSKELAAYTAALKRKKGARRASASR